MSSRIFQSVVLQMKDSTERAIGVIDSEGTVVACNELSCIGEHWPGAVEVVNRGEGDAVRFDGRTFKALAGWGAQFDYAAFVKGEDPEAQMLCAMATVALNGAKNAAVLAAQILALGEPQLAAALKAEREAMAETIAKKDEALQNEIASL